MTVVSIGLTGIGMVWDSFIGPAVVAALVSGFVAMVSAFVNRRTLLEIHSEKLDADRALAESKFKYDRDLAVWKRKTEIAEEVLSDFHKAIFIFQAARQPFSFVGEGASRLIRGENESEGEKTYRNAVYTPYERLEKERDFFTAMLAKRYRFISHFGNDAAEPFRALQQCYTEVQHATEALINNAANTYSKELRSKYEDRIGWGEVEKDEIQIRLNNAKDKIEGICRPIISSIPK
ncbi:hypothetical protein IR196_04780 [Brucella anthropi]|uniref:hypothetical protein n=1 Tax=Brucella anthropi TaxID=529 RepID=UPI00188D5B0D|nr:hypothetical protein [Brucella anthropi]QPA27184.1 hypothetical protein IR196_04780 [Brucella anthropi]